MFTNCVSALLQPTGSRLSGSLERQLPLLLLSPTVRDSLLIVYKLMAQRWYLFCCAFRLSRWFIGTSTACHRTTRFVPRSSCSQIVGSRSMITNFLLNGVKSLWLPVLLCRPYWKEHKLQLLDCHDLTRRLDVSIEESKNVIHLQITISTYRFNLDLSVNHVHRLGR